MKESRPDDSVEAQGWVAWHPTSGAAVASLSKMACEQKLTGVGCENFEIYEEFIIAHETRLNKLIDNGWRIRPVKLVFLDEVKE